jgi:activator of 2-hydroxyglutaryl-CoA dehydratase
MRVQDLQTDNLNKSTYHMGIDIGSTTVKIALIDHRDGLVFSRYQRHYSDIWKAIEVLIREISLEYNEISLTVAVTGSGSAKRYRFQNEWDLCGWNRGIY